MEVGHNADFTEYDAQFDNHIRKSCIRPKLHVNVRSMAAGVTGVALVEKCALDMSWHLQAPNQASNMHMLQVIKSGVHDARQYFALLGCQVMGMAGRGGN